MQKYKQLIDILSAVVTGDIKLRTQVSFRSEIQNKNYL